MWQGHGYGAWMWPPNAHQSAGVRQHTAPVLAPATSSNNTAAFAAVAAVPAMRSLLCATTMEHGGRCGGLAVCCRPVRHHFRKPMDARSHLGCQARSATSSASSSGVPPTRSAKDALHSALYTAVVPAPVPRITMSTSASTVRSPTPPTAPPLPCERATAAACILRTA
eukprot:363584-Chlamydomonas_euryale.AAC.6